MHELSGKPCRPINGTGGEIFRLMHCGHCARHEACIIMTNAMIFEIGDRNYPRQLVHDDDGYPTCTAFTMRKPQEAGRCAGTIDMFEGNP